MNRLLFCVPWFISSDTVSGDVYNLQNGQVLLMTFGPAVAGTAFFLENQELCPALMADDLRADLGGFATGGEKNRITGEIQGIPFLEVEFFNPDLVVFSDF